MKSTCRYCGKEFEQSRADNVFCSNKCCSTFSRHHGSRAEWLKGHSAEEIHPGIYRKTCETCGKKFISLSIYQCFCEDCSNERKRRRGSEWAKNNRDLASKKRKAWYHENIDHARELRREWDARNRDKKRESYKKWYNSHREEYREKKRKYHEENKEKDREYRLNYYKKNREREIKRSIKYRNDHLEECRERERRYKVENREKLWLKRMRKSLQNENLENSRTSCNKFKQKVRKMKRMTSLFGGFL